MSLLVGVALVGALPMPGEAEDRQFTAAFERGEALYGKGEFGAAIALFREADRLKVTPEVAFDLARSFEKLGEVGMTTFYDRLYLARSTDASDAKEVFTRLSRTLDKAEEDGRGYLEVVAPLADAVSIGGRMFPAPPAALFLPAGAYVIEASFGKTTKKLKVEVTAGQATSVRLEGVRAPLVSSDAAPDEAVSNLARPGPAPRSGNGARIASYVLMGLGAAALGTGVAMGALSSADAARSADKRLTVREATAAAQDANGKGTVANVLFVSGGVAALAGGVTFLVSLPEPGLKEPSR